MGKKITVTESQFRKLLREGINEISMQGIANVTYGVPKWWHYANMIENILMEIEGDSLDSDEGFDSNPNIKKLVDGLNMMKDFCNAKEAQKERISGEYDRMEANAKGDEDFQETYDDDEGGTFFDDMKFGKSQYGDLYRKYNN